MNGSRREHGPLCQANVLRHSVSSCVHTVLLAMMDSKSSDPRLCVSEQHSSIS